MTRWLFILLAVILGWFPPATAHAHTRPPNPAACDLGPTAPPTVCTASPQYDAQDRLADAPAARRDIRRLAYDATNHPNLAANATPRPASWPYDAVSNQPGTVASTATPQQFWTLDTYEGDNEDPLSLHKYLYGWDNPVNVTDPSGHDGDLGSLMISANLGAGLDAMYNGGVLAAYNSMQHTIIGVQNGQTANAILGSYIEDVAIGVGIGIGVGMVADIAGDLVYGGNVEGETVSIEVNTPTVGASRNFVASESTTEGLMGAAARAAKAVEQEPQPVWGTKVHTEFSKDVKAMGLNSEVSYKGGKPDVYGKDSVRLDAVKGPKNAPEAVYDLKTGKQGLTKARIQQIRDNLPPGYQDIPIIEIRP